MDRQIVDQTASELHLHRALWVIKFLRASVLHSFLALVAFLWYFLAGMDGAYPLATDLIRAVRAGAIVYQLQQDNPYAALAYAIVASMVFVAMLALLRWIYISITQLQRYSLRFQAVLVSWITLISIAPQKRQELQFAFENLNALFAVLALLGVAMVALVLPLSAAFALWGVSRAPERSCLLATLDLRLAPNTWSRLNKLLDLPRTPFRTRSALVAYGLALAGAVLFVASVMYLATVGSTGNKLSALATICRFRSEQMPACVAQSTQWAWTIPLFLVVAFAGVKVAALLQSAAKRIGGLSVSDVLRSADDKFVLYLRPFDVDGVILPKPRLPWLSRFFSFRPFPVRIEEELFDVADGYLPLIAVGKPGSGATPGGAAYRAFLDDTAWQDYVLEKIRGAERIVMVLKNTDGVRWEFERVVAEGAVDKTLFLFDPTMKTVKDWSTVEQMVVPLLQGIGVAPGDPGFASRPIGFYVQDGQLIEIVNNNWSATSYRTAFSHFLAESDEKKTGKRARQHDIFPAPHPDATFARRGKCNAAQSSRHGWSPGMG